MKLLVLLACSVAANLNETERSASIQDEKVLLDNPAARLGQLTRFSDDLLDNWFGFLKSKNAWKTKFAKNAYRMQIAYERCGHYDKSVDYAGKYAVPVSKVTDGAKIVPLLTGMAAKNVAAIHLKLDGEFNAPYKLYLTPNEGTRKDGFMIQFGLKSGTKTGISTCSSDTLCKELDWAGHTRRRFKLRQELLIRYDDGHINVYNARYPDDEVISFYSHAIKRVNIKHLSISTNNQSKPYIATVENVLYDKHQPDELPIKLYTPNRYHYQTILDGLASKGINRVKLDFGAISNDAHIAIASGLDKTSSKWEIILGAKGATQTIIKACPDCSASARLNHSKDDYRFWSTKGIFITLEQGRLSLSDSRGREIIQVSDPRLRRGKMKFLQVASTTGASGIWTISEIDFVGRERREAAEFGAYNATTNDYSYYYDEYDQQQQLQADPVMSEFNITRGVEIDADTSDMENDVFAMRIDEIDPFRAVKQLTTGYTKWTKRFIGNCRGQQRNAHQQRRMELWNQKLLDHLAAKF